MRRLDGSSWIQICDIVVIIGVTLTSAYGEDIRKWFLVLPILEYHIPGYCTFLLLII